MFSIYSIFIKYSCNVSLIKEPSNFVAFKIFRDSQINNRKIILLIKYILAYHWSFVLYDYDIIFYKLLQCFYSIHEKRPLKFLFHFSYVRQLERSHEDPGLGLSDGEIPCGCSFNKTINVSLYNCTSIVDRQVLKLKL